MKKILALTGAAGSGKDTAAERLVGQHGFQRFAFADHMKDVLAVLFAPLGIEKDVFFDRFKKEAVIPSLGVSPRHIMQTFGTDWARQMIKDDIWLMIAKAKLQAASANVVITDVRFENEANLVRELGGTVLHVSGRATSAQGQAQSHASEAGVAVGHGDILVDNSRDIEWLHKSMDAIVSYLVMVAA